MSTTCALTAGDPACACGSESGVLIKLGGGGVVTCCLTCGLLARYPMPRGEELLNFYRDKYCSQDLREQTESSRQNLYCHALDWVETFRSTPGTLVDVGCGMGALLAISQARGWRAIGFDPSRAAVASARERGLDAIEAAWPPSTLREGTVDVVTFVNVLDHLPDPFAALREAWRVLKPGGVLYVRVPNGPMHARLTRILSVLGWHHLAVMHLFGFGRTAFLHHLPRLGFSAPIVRAAPLSQGDADRATGAPMFSLRPLLRIIYRALHQLATRTGLGKRGWGLSLEVIAVKIVSQRGM